MTSVATPAAAITGIQTTRPADGNADIPLLAQANVRPGNGSALARAQGVGPLLAPVSGPYVPKGSMEIKGLANYRENAGPWAHDPYQFGDRNNPLKGTMGELGCTISAFSNAMSVNTQKNPSFAAPTPGDANVRSGKFENALQHTRWKSLTVPSLLNAEGKPTFNPLRQPIDISSLKGEALIKAIRTEVAAGRPVVLGLTGNQEGFVRHTVLVTGLVPGKTGPESLIVRDQWRGANDSRDTSKDVKPALLTTLAETMKAYPGAHSRGYTQIDMAVSAAPGGR
jgi:hypothetical protein